MAETVAQLRSLSDEEIIARHDQQADATGVGIAHYLAELARRDQDRATQAMLKSTRTVERLTWVITVLTAVNVIAAVVAVVATVRAT